MTDWIENGQEEEVILELDITEEATEVDRGVDTEEVSTEVVSTEEENIEESTEEATEEEETELLIRTQMLMTTALLL